MAGIVRTAQTLGATLCLASLACCTPMREDAGLASSHWTFALIDGQRPLSDAADMQFHKGRMSVLIGCNRLSGPWRMAADRLVAGPLVESEMRCPAPAWDQEKSVGALLSATPRVILGKERLILKSGGHTAELVPVDD